ncbi:hypothetical protein SBA5_450064 [Candidatus Sulfotelmatomonas gaucii]|uniref:Uncharacterized protein n=1 Tax=Candidatus Sulfuritelmatomonas gaucii TaxID=2043161 RepID=A0A2N9LMV4_9BACT|nr:hypothetical protein SBA5_450064 [Candidatus Sulfotelmatomonas gaucii]
MFLTTDLFARSANKYAILTVWRVMWAWKIHWPGFHVGVSSGDNRTVNQPFQGGIQLVIPRVSSNSFSFHSRHRAGKRHPGPGASSI